MSLIQCQECEEFIDTAKHDFDVEHELCKKCWLKMKAEEHELKERGMGYE